ncbi:hypothetical protein J4221_02930 [Candidatus Pacearchaeota archaeon]|nr:hypothetical protein [Candidatus Pacearchaeota archaeon]
MRPKTLEQTARLDDDSMRRAEAVDMLLREFDSFKNLGLIIPILKHSEYDDSREKIEQGLSERGVQVIQERIFFSRICELFTDNNYIVKEDFPLSYIVFSYDEKLSQNRYKIRIPTTVNDSERERIFEEIKELPSIDERVDFLENRIREILAYPSIKHAGKIRIPSREKIRSYVVGESDIANFDYYKYPGTSVQEEFPLIGACDYIRKYLRDSPRLHIRFANYMDIVNRNITLVFKK